MYKQDDKVEVGRFNIKIPSFPYLQSIIHFHSYLFYKNNTQSISWPANWTPYLMKSVFAICKEQFTTLPLDRELTGRDVCHSLFTGNYVYLSIDSCNRTRKKITLQGWEEGSLRELIDEQETCTMFY